MKKKFLSLIALVALAVGITVAVNYVPGNGLKLLGKSEKAEFAGKLNSSSMNIKQLVDVKGMSVTKGSFSMPKMADEGWSEWEDFAPGGSNDAVWDLAAWAKEKSAVKCYVRTSTTNAAKKQIKVTGYGAGILTEAGVDIVINWDTTTNNVRIPIQLTGYYNSSMKEDVVFGDVASIMGEQYASAYPSTYDPEQGKFSFSLLYSVPSVITTGSGFGLGVETLQMAGAFKDYTLSFSRGTVDDAATPIKQTVNVNIGKDITSYRVHVDTYENYAAAQGSAAYFEALAKAEGTDYTDPSVTVDLQGSEYNIYVVVVSAFADGVMMKYDYDMYEVSPASDWETIGVRPYREDIVTSLYNFQLTGPVYNVEVQKHKTYRDIYRIKNPYGSTSPFKNYTLYENAYLYLNAQDPTMVKPTFRWSNCDLGIDIEGGVPLDVYLADKTVGGTYDGYAISFPTKALVSDGYYVNTNGLFRAVINFRDAEFAFADSAKSVYTGETVKIISNNTFSTPTFESLTPKIATVDAKGVVTAVAPGKAQIKVVQDAILEFNAKEAVMEIDVEKNPNSYASFVFNTDEGLAVLGIEKPAASAATNLTGMTLTSGDVSMTSTDGGTATRVWNTNDVTDLRMYKNGGSFTFSVPEGYKIISIDFTGTECSLFGEESEFETCTKAHTVWNAPEGESVTSKTFAAVGTCKISAIKVKYSAPSLLPPLASNAYYSWQSPEGVVEEVGGKAVAVGDTTRVNYKQLEYYTISLNGKFDSKNNDGKYISVTLDKALVEGDTIYVYAFKNKDDASKKSGVKFLWGEEGGLDTAMACGDDFPNLYSGGEPALVKYVVPKDAAGKNVFRMTRSETGTNLFIAQLQIVPAGEAPASTSNLGNIIGKAVEGKAQGETAVVTLDATVAYDLKNPVDAGLVNLVVHGNGAIVKLGPTGQIAGMQGIEINNVNFDCDNNTIAPIALSANPDSVLVGSKFQEEGTSLRGGAFYNTGAVVINGCNFSGIHTSWISANKREWNLKTLKIVNTIAQFDVATGIDSYINWTGNSNNEGSIKDIVIEGSTLYNIVENNDNRFLRLQNNSNSQAQKAWAEPQFDAKESWTMTNNTFVNMPSNKEFANNYPNKNNVTLDFKGNIFYNTWRLQKISSSAVRNFTAADNSIIGITNAVDGTDASSYATIDSLLIIGEKPFVVPTAALDLSKEIDLKANFQPYGLSYAGQMGFGDPRWKAEVYDAGLALDVDTVEYLGVRAKRANSWKFQGVGETFEIKVTTGNKAMPVVYASSNEAVVTVTPEGLATAVAPGSAIITMTQEPTAEFKAATLEMNVQVLPKAEYKKMYADADMDYMGINLSDVLAPVVVGGKTFYQIADSVASFVGYFDPTAPAQVQTSNRKMFIDYATDEPIEGGAAVASTDGTITVAPIAGALNTHTNPNVPKQMYFLVSNTDSVKFYYTGSSGSGSTVTLWVINAAGETIATVEGGAAAGKGTTSNVLTYTMPDKGNYKLAVWGTSGDMEVYYAKFFCETKPEPITEPREWNFSNIKNDYADEYAAIWHSPDYWSDGGTRASNVVAFDGEELTVDGATKIGFTEGLFWTAAAGKLLIGDGSSKNYQCIQTQKGVKFYIPQVAAGDTIKFVGCAPSKAGTFTFENAEPATIDVSKGSSYTEFVVVMTADGEFVYNAPQDFRLQSIAVIPEGTVPPSGINDISAKNAKFFGEGIYDLNGRKVLNPVKGNIYIVNGKKYIAR